MAGLAGKRMDGASRFGIGLQDLRRQRLAQNLVVHSFLDLKQFNIEKIRFSRVILHTWILSPWAKRYETQHLAIETAMAGVYANDPAIRFMFNGILSQNTHKRNEDRDEFT